MNFPISNNSWGGGGYSKALKDVIQKLETKDSSSVPQRVIVALTMTEDLTTLQTMTVQMSSQSQPPTLMTNSPTSHAMVKQQSILPLLE